MRTSSTTQAKRRHLFGALLAAILLPALVAVLLPSSPATETIVATAPVSATQVPSSSVTTTAAPTTTTPPTTAAPVTTTTAKKKTTTTTTAAPTTTTTAPKKQAAYVAPTTTAPPVYYAPAPEAPSGDADAWAFLACVKQRESHGNYSIVSSNGMWHGAYQFAIQSWDATARHAGRGDLVGVLPSQASPADQDAMALELYYWQGKAPWGGYC